MALWWKPSFLQHVLESSVSLLWAPGSSMAHPFCLRRCLTVCALSHFSRVRLFATPWTVAFQVPLSIGFSRQEYWSGLLFPPPRDLPNPGFKLVAPVALALAGGFFTTEPLGSPQTYKHIIYFLSQKKRGNNSLLFCMELFQLTYDAFVIQMTK